MQSAPELGIPEVKPAIESIFGRWEPKMSPRRRHSIVQGRMCGLLAQWAGDPSSLVPDVAVEILSPGDRRSLLDEKLEIAVPSKCTSRATAASFGFRNTLRRRFISTYRSTRENSSTRYSNAFAGPRR